jgi:hypothetical protein
MQRRGEGMLSPSAMNNCLATLIKNVGLPGIGITRINLLRTAFIEAYRSGMSTTDLMITSGFSAETIRTILAMDIEQYSPIADCFINRQDVKVKRLKSLKLRRKYMT